MTSIPAMSFAYRTTSGGNAGYVYGTPSSRGAGVFRFSIDKTEFVD
jgi:hypothetical protein